MQNCGCIGRLTAEPIFFFVFAHRVSPPCFRLFASIFVVAFYFSCFACLASFVLSMYSCALLSPLVVSAFPCFRDLVKEDFCFFGYVPHVRLPLSGRMCVTGNWASRGDWEHGATVRGGLRWSYEGLGSMGFDIRLVWLDGDKEGASGHADSSSVNHGLANERIDFSFFSALLI